MVETHVAALPDALANRSNVDLTDLRTALKEADILVLLVNHQAFADVDPEILKEKVVIDTRGMWR